MDEKVVLMLTVSQLKALAGTLADINSEYAAGDDDKAIMRIVLQTGRELGLEDDFLFTDLAKVYERLTWGKEDAK